MLTQLVDFELYLFSFGYSLPYTRNKRFLPVWFGLRCGVSNIPVLPIKRLLPKSPKRLPQLCSSPSLLRGRSASSPMLVDYYAPPSPRSLMPILIVCCRGCLWIIGAYPHSPFSWTFETTCCRLSRRSYFPILIVQENPLRNKVFLPLSIINSMESEKGMEDVYFFRRRKTSVESITIFKLFY